MNPELTALITAALDLRASDLHIIAGVPRLFALTVRSFLPTMMP